MACLCNKKDYDLPSPNIHIQRTTMVTTKNAKKRAAPTNSSTASKKQRLGKYAASEKKFHRKAPVTRIQAAAEDSDGTDVESDDEQSEEGDWDNIGSSSGDFEEMEGGEAEFEDSDKEGENDTEGKQPKSANILFHSDVLPLLIS